MRVLSRGVSTPTTIATGSKTSKLSHQGVLVVHNRHVALSLAVARLGLASLVVRGAKAVLASHGVDLGLGELGQLLGRLDVRDLLLVALGKDKIGLF